jgi:predicted helicase
VPAVDAVVFAAKKESEIDIVQSAGRALRRSPHGAGVATFLVPVFLTDPSGAADEVDSSGGDEWGAVCRVLRALRAHDPRLEGLTVLTCLGESGFMRRVSVFGRTRRRRW